MTLLEIWVEPGSRAIKMTLGLIIRIAFTDAVSDMSSVTTSVKFLISGFYNFLNRVASTRTAFAVSLTLGPGITG
jgi:hypothetical protein